MGWFTMPGAGSAGSTVLGRQDELATVRRVLDDTRAGNGTSLVLRGEPGTGLSTLLDAAAEAAGGFTVIRCRGCAADAAVPYRAVADLAAQLAGPAVPQPSVTSGYRVGAGLAAAAAEAAPLLVLVDDAHLLDADSAHALLALARRSLGQPVSILVGLALGSPSAWDGFDAAVLPVGGLDAPAAEQLLWRHRPDIDTATARRLYAQTAGHPLALVELAARYGIEPAPSRLPAVGPRTVAGFAPLLDPLPEPARRALLVAAASWRGRMAEVAGALDRVGLPGAALDPAQIAGLLRASAGRWRFRHPVLRAVVYHRAPAPQRRAAHRALADWLNEHGGLSDAEQRAWHLAESVPGLDEAAATTLEAAARRSHRAGQPARARAALERAAAVSPAREERARRAQLAARTAALAGDAPRAELLLAAAGDRTTDPGRRAELGTLREELQVVRRGPGRFPEPGVVEHPGGRLAVAVWGAVLAGRADTLSELTRHLGQDDTTEDLALAYAGARLLHGAPAEAVAVVRERLDRLGAGDPTRFAVGTLALAGLVLAVTENCAAGRALLTRSVAVLRGLGAAERLSTLMVLLAETELRAGRWAVARVTAQDGAVLAERLGQRPPQALALSVLARLDAWQGLGARALEQVRRLRALALPTRTELALLWGDCGAGLAEATARPAEAVRRLAGVATRLPELGVRELAVVPYHGDLVDVLIRTGQRDRAAAVVGECAPLAARSGSRTVQAVQARCRAQVDGGGGARDGYLAALALHDGAADPYQAARTRLAFGRWLRRERSRAEAREQLRQARDAFDRLGAVPAAAEADAELRIIEGAAGPVRGGGAAAARLTGQETRVALLAASGATNEDIARSLELSEKTVVHHLGNAYRKLGVRSRSELPARLADVHKGQ